MNIYETERARVSREHAEAERSASLPEMQRRQIEYDRIAPRWPTTVTHLKADTRPDLPAFNRLLNQLDGEARWTRSRCGYANKFLALTFSDDPTCEFCKAIDRAEEKAAD